MAETAELAAVTITEAPAMSRYSLRARDAEVLGGVIGCELPAKIGTTAGPIACLGPDEWLLRVPAGETVPMGEGDSLSLGAGQAVSMVDVSDRSVGYVLEGPRAIEVIEAGCPRDVRKLPVGAAVRTVWEGVEIVLLREAEARYVVDVWRSFAPWLELAFRTAAKSLR